MMEIVQNIILAVPSSIWVAFICVVGAYIWGTWPYRQLKNLGIPGPKPTAFFGNLLDMKKKGVFKLDPELLNKYGDVVSFYMGRYPGIIVADPEMIKQIMVKDFSVFTNRSNLQPGDKIAADMVLRARDEKWKFLRTILSPNFTSKKMRQMVPLVHTALLTLEKNCEIKSKSGEQVDINALFGGYTMDVIASTSFGIEVDSQNDPNNPFVKNAMKTIRTDRFRFIFLLSFICNPLFKLFVSSTYILNSVVSSRKFLINFCRMLLADRKEKKILESNDLLQMMINTQEGPNASEETNGIGDAEQKTQNPMDTSFKRRKMTDQEIVAQCFIFFLAGYETTASTLSFMAHSLSLNPDIQKKLTQEIKDILGDELPDYDNIQKLPYLDQCMSETLRKYPIATRVIRHTSRDITIKNWQFPKNTEVIIPIYGLHHNPKYWPDPHKFDPERFSPEAQEKHTPFTYLPFGGGPRICIGMRLAQMELKMAMVQILRKFKFVPCEKTEDVIVFNNSPLLTPQNGITLKIEKL